MATRIKMHNTRTVPEAGSIVIGDTAAPQADIMRANNTGTPTYPWDAAYDSLEPVGERKFARTTASEPVSFWSERVADASVDIAGQILIGVSMTITGVFTYKLRMRIWKITAGGSAIRTLIVTATSGEFTTSGFKTFLVTPPESVTVVRGERFIAEITMSEWTGAGPFSIALGSSQTYIEFLETLTFLDNAPKLYLRRTNVNAIDDFFDLSLTRGSSAAIAGVVATEAGATELQWTRSVAETFGATDISAAAVADTANASTYVSASFTPVANRLYLLAVVHSDAAPETTVPTVATTTGLTFVQVGSSIVFDTISSNLHRLTLFRAMKASGLSAGTYTVTLADAGTGCCARLTEVTDVVTTGTDGADAVINVSTNNGDASANPSVTLAAFNSVDNGTYACFASDIATAPTAGSGFTGLGHSTIGTPTKGVFAEWRATNDTSANCTLASSDWAGIAVELVQSTAAPIFLEWISPPVKDPFYVTAIEFFTSRIWSNESDLAANASWRMKYFHRAPDGTETLIATVNKTSEFITTSTNSDFTSASANHTFTFHVTGAFREDDRWILRMYAINVGTMGGGFTCTTTYDHNAANVSGDAWIAVNGVAAFKAEGDPAASQAIPGGMSTLGLGNDGA